MSTTISPIGYLSCLQMINSLCSALSHWANSTKNDKNNTTASLFVKQFIQWTKKNNLLSVLKEFVTSEVN